MRFLFYFWRELLERMFLRIQEFKNSRIQWNKSFCISTLQTRMAGSSERDAGFIGDLIIGQQRADETVFRRNIQVSNPTKRIYSTRITFNVNNGKFFIFWEFNQCTNSVKIKLWIIRVSRGYLMRFLKF